MNTFLPHVESTKIEVMPQLGNEPRGEIAYQSYGERLQRILRVLRSEKV